MTNTATERRATQRYREITGADPGRWSATERHLARHAARQEARVAELELALWHRAEADACFR